MLFNPGTPSSWPLTCFLSLQQLVTDDHERQSDSGSEEEDEPSGQTVPVGQLEGQVLQRVQEHGQKRSGNGFIRERKSIVGLCCYVMTRRRRSFLLECVYLQVRELLRAIHGGWCCSGSCGSEQKCGPTYFMRISRFSLLKIWSDNELSSQISGLTVTHFPSAQSSRVSFSLVFIL